MRLSAQVSVAGLLALASAVSVTGRGAVGTVCAPRVIALGFTNAQQRTTWGRATLRVAAAIFAALAGLRILRGEHETQARPRPLAADGRLGPALPWGREGRVTMAVDQVSGQALPGLRSETHALARRKRQ